MWNRLSWWLYINVEFTCMLTDGRRIRIQLFPIYGSRSVGEYTGNGTVYQKCLMWDYHYTYPLDEDEDSYGYCDNRLWSIGIPFTKRGLCENLRIGD